MGQPAAAAELAAAAKLAMAVAAALGSPWEGRNVRRDGRSGWRASRRDERGWFVYAAGSAVDRQCRDRERPE